MKHLLLLISFVLLLSCSKDDEVDSGNNNPPSTLVSLPVKAVSKDGNGNIITRTITYTYDSSNRISKMKVIDKDPALSAVTTYNYENGRITLLKNYDDASKPLEKKVYFYNASGMVKEEEYINNSLTYVNEWFNRSDGGKERRIKNTSGHLFETWYYRFDSAGNIERVVLDYTDTADEDTEYNFSNYDNKQHSIVNYLTYVLPGILMEIKETKLSHFNNPKSLTQKGLSTGNLLANFKIEYVYNTQEQVVQRKTYEAATANLAGITTIEYKEF